MSLVVNCDCTDTFDSRTLAQMRQMMLDALGFTPPLSGYTARSLSSMIADVKVALGIPTPLSNIATRSLTNLLNDMYPMMGWGAISGSPPPGANSMLTEYINLAQQDLWRSLELDQGTNSIPALLVAGSDATTLDYVPVINMATGLAKAYYNQPDAQLYLGAAQKYLTDFAARSPPNINAIITSALQNAQQVVYRRYEMGYSGTITIGPFASPGDTTTVDPQPVFLLALVNLKKKIGQADTEDYQGQYDHFMLDQLHRNPPNAATIVNRLLKDTQQMLYRRYDIFRMERWYTWTLVNGTRFYGILANDEITADPPCLRYMDPRLITFVGISNGDNNWRPIRKGIPPGLYNSNQTGPPTHYEIRQCIELWPTPTTPWLLRIKGTFGLDPFEADGDTTSMDWQAIYLSALADAKATYKQPDAQLAGARAREYIGDLVAGEHSGARYFPGTDRVLIEAVRPVMV